MIPVLHSGSDGGDGGGGEVGRGGVRVGGEVGSEGVNRETVASTNHPTLPPDNSMSTPVLLYMLFVAIM